MLHANQFSIDARRNGRSLQSTKEIGYDLTFYRGKKDDKYMKDLLPDWQAQGITSVLHEKNSGYGPNRGANLFQKLVTVGAKFLKVFKLLI